MALCSGLMKTHWFPLIMPAIKPLFLRALQKKDWRMRICSHPDNGNDDRNANSGGTIEQISARGMRVITNVIVVPQQILASLSFSPCLISGWCKFIALIGMYQRFRRYLLPVFCDSSRLVSAYVLMWHFIPHHLASCALFFHFSEFRTLISRF